MDETRAPEPQAFLPLRTRPLFILSAVLAPPRSLSGTPCGDRKIVAVIGGTVTGERVSGQILPGGSDWALARADGVLMLNVRLLIETHDAALISCEYAGMRHGPDAVMKRLAAGDLVDPAEMYFRIAPRFETADSRYSWLNRILAIGVGERLAAGPRYHIHEVL